LRWHYTKRGVLMAKVKMHWRDVSPQMTAGPRPLPVSMAPLPGMLRGAIVGAIMGAAIVAGIVIEYPRQGSHATPAPVARKAPVARHPYDGATRCVIEAATPSQVACDNGYRGRVL